ncbi:MAG: hypothetical protein ACP5PQ_00845 [Thermoproteota archaeon]
MSPKRAMLIGVLVYLLSMITGLYNMWYLRQVYNPTTLSILVIIQVAFSFISIALVGYGTFAYLITVIREAVRKREESRE